MFFSECRCNLRRVGASVVLLKPAIAVREPPFKGRHGILTERFNMRDAGDRAFQRHQWPQSLSREASPVHTAGTVLHGRHKTGGRPLVLCFPPHPAATVLLELGEGGLVTPQHLRPVSCRPACMLQTPCKACRFVCLADERLLSCKAIPKSHGTKHTANSANGDAPLCCLSPECLHPSST
jgi:hypothetical protein